MADNTIKSFLVKIGYKHDEVALKKITVGIEQATKSVIAFGAALTAVATTVAWGVTRIASDLEGLYFASRRTGESARHLEAFDLAAQRMGANAGEGIAAVGKLMQEFRTHAPAPGLITLKVCSRVHRSPNKIQLQRCSASAKPCVIWIASRGN